MVGFLILMHFGASLVFCNDDIPFCKKRLTALKDDVKDWQEKCVNDKVQDIDTTTCCKAKKEYNQKRMSMQTELCFYKGNESICSSNVSW